MCVCVCFVSPCYHVYDPYHGTLVYPTSSCACFLCACALPALLLNNPAYHLLLSDHRKGLRPLVVPSTAQTQEKSLNVPQGKTPWTRPMQSGGARGIRNAHVVVSKKNNTKRVMSLFCMWPTFIIHPLTHIIYHSHSLTTQNDSCFCLKG